MDYNIFLFGLEFEFYLKDESEKETFINALNASLKINLIDLTHTSYAENPDEWILSVEKTMPILRNKKGYEFTTPILEYEELSKTLNIVLGLIYDYGFTNESCGFHFHISTGSENLSVPNIIKFLLFLNENKIFDDYKIRNDYALNIMDVLKNTNLSIFKKFYKCLGKYYNVYFVDLEQKHVEIRILGDENYEQDEYILEFINDVTKCFYLSMTDEENEKYDTILKEFKKSNRCNQSVLCKEELESLAKKHQITFEEMFQKAKRESILNTERRLPND